MVKMIIAFLLLFVIFYTGIEIVRKLTGKEKWVLTKTLLYSILCSSLAVMTLGLIASEFWKYF